MNERENESFEAELRRLSPARLPDEFLERLDCPPPMPSPEIAAHRPRRAWRPAWSSWRRWLAPMTAMAAMLVVLVVQWNRGKDSTPLASVALAPILKADQVEIDRQWLDSFDAVANMPDGEPVRFRFQQWMDAVTLRDSVRGIEYVQRTPRIEVVPVSFDTY